MLYNYNTYIIVRFFLAFWLFNMVKMHLLDTLTEILMLYNTTIERTNIFIKYLRLTNGFKVEHQW